MANKDFMDPELTEEEKEDMIIKNEEDYLEGLLAAADDAANIIAFFLVPFFNCTNTFLFL